MPLEQVSLGGEPVDQAVLDQLTELFPNARVSWIYASSELGASIVVHDGRAGFPVEWLERDAPDRPRLAVEDGELVIASPHHGEGLEGAVRTGDAVVIEDGRVLITGRTSADEINVGGSKVSAGRGALGAPVAPRGRLGPRARPQGAAGRHHGGGRRRAEVRRDHRARHRRRDPARWCQERLPEYGVPRRIKLLDSIPQKETLKSDV